MTESANNLLPQHDAAMLQHEAVLQRALEAEYAEVAATLQSQLDDLIAQGQPAVQSRLLSLITQIDTQLAAFAHAASVQISAAQQDAAQLATQHAHALITAGIGAPAGVAVALNGPRAAAIAALIGRTFDGSPLADLLAKLGPEVAATVKQALISGIAAGAGPRQIARTFQDAIDGGRTRALLVARTEVLGAYRAATLENYRANSDVVGGWVWSSDGKACDICAAKNGKDYPLTTPFETHPNCRCVSLPRTKTWAELGFSASLYIVGFALQETVTFDPWEVSFGN